MLIKVTEVNLWEKEKWSYVLDVNLIGAEAMSLLMSFLRLAKSDFEKYQNKSMPVQAISNYFYDFYDSLENNVLIRSGQRLHLSSSSTYKDGCLNTKKKLSIRRLKKARDTIRDKNENLLYKNFEWLYKK